ncbi:flagellar assembly peptidoglycan hydrolase FlgJ [Castellaniella sp.]|uniref:flagellar assembly peptidoglycan hydrolase FlgJ n=1 Tax=Castellaniella sp. TaxID=1955812 RepID=UPI00356999BA
MTLVTHTPLPRFGMAPSALDFSGLDALRLQVQPGREPDAADFKAVARQFESLLIQTLLRQARQTAQGMAGLPHSSARQMAQSLADDQLALAMTETGFGLAEALVAQMNLGRGLPSDDVSPLDLSAGAGMGHPGRDWVADSIDELLQKMALGGGDATPRADTENQPPAGPVQAFISQMWDAAQRAAQGSGLPAELILAQAALESGWGQREIRHADGRSSHNLFGIKAGAGWTGPTAEVMTTEFIEGMPRKMVQTFRAYDSYQEAFADYARLISRSPRYRSVLEARDPADAARRIQAAGYATDPAYADKLVAVMDNFRGLSDFG